MEKVVYVAYSRKSCVTGRALFEYLKQEMEGFKIRRISSKNKAPKLKADFVVRWGNSYHEFDCPEINTLESVINASDKLVMANTLAMEEDVNFPSVYFGEPIDSKNGAEVLRFYRSFNNEVECRTNWVEGDKYCTDEVDKAREFRVHVAFGKTVGVYEKVPHEGESGKIRKDSNCDFVRLDMGQEKNREELRGVRPMCRKAVESLGLDIGGVDVLIDKSGDIFINEVNSSPALNSINIERVGSKIKETIIKKEETDENA